MLRRIVAIAALLAAVSAEAALDDAGRCCAAKVRASGVREKQLLRCHARAASRGVTVDAACVAAAGEALDRQFARAEAQGGCAASGDATVVVGDVTRAVGDVVALVRPVATTSACAARKLKATGRLAQSLAKAFAAEAPRPADHLAEIDIDTATLVARFQATFARLESAGGCPSTGDASTVLQLVSVGSSAPTVPDGILRISLRLCEPTCGDAVQGGAEQCDGSDAASCPGGCTATCACPTCGDGVKNQASETCDGADAAACQGLCQPGCTCPPPVCGNGVQEAGEACDGAALGACGSCESDCTCGPAVCGNDVVEQGEQCDGGPSTCGLQGDPGAGCTAACQCCSDSYCEILGCCDPGDKCIDSQLYGYCFTVRCRPDHPCRPGYVCTTIGTYGDFCLAQVGSLCADAGTTLADCELPAVCSNSNYGFCCLPAGESCSGSGCCSGTCSGGVCS